MRAASFDFVRQVFVTFGGNTTVLTLFLLSVLYLALKRKKKGRAVCVRNNRCFSGLYGIQSICGEIYPGKTWNGQCLLPVFLDSADGTDHRICLHESCGRAEKGWRRYLTAAALAAVICFGGNSVLAGGLPKLPDNQYKMPDDLLAVCTVLHEEAGEGTVRVVF